MISVIIPVSCEDFKSHSGPYLGEAIKNCQEEVEVILVLNNLTVGCSKAKNLGAEKAHGDTLVFLDWDNEVSSNFFLEISQKSKNPYFVGGGVKWVRLSRYSLGILISMIPLALFLIVHQITVGALWIKKAVFFELTGFGNNKYAEIDLALELKKYARNNSRKFESIKNSFIIWSTRKFDKYGDWHWMRGYHTNNI